MIKTFFFFFLYRKENSTISSMINEYIYIYLFLSIESGIVLTRSICIGSKILLDPIISFFLLILIYNVD